MLFRSTSAPAPDAAFSVKALPEALALNPVRLFAVAKVFNCAARALTSNAGVLIISWVAVTPIDLPATVME